MVVTVQVLFLQGQEYDIYIYIRLVFLKIPHKKNIIFYHRDKIKIEYFSKRRHRT